MRRRRLEEELLEDWLEGGSVETRLGMEDLWPWTNGAE
jgi:hypothetical protein